MAASKRVWALLALFLCLNVALAGVLRPIPRQDDASTVADTATATESATRSATDSATISSTAGGDGNSVTTSTSETGKDATASSTLTGSPTVSATSSVSVSPTSSANSTSFNGKLPHPAAVRSCFLTPATATIAEGQLPLKPHITPGMSVGGVVLMISGVAYAMVGIKTRWLHCFFSVGFLAALGVTVLILYVMNPPISNAIQAGYVMAALATGALLGGASLIFQDMLECLACLLGGFSLAMWLLTLRAGGLVDSGKAGVTIFICVFSAAGLAGYFSRWTREHFMIACISFSGSTVAVLGIDCFTRAGLKEFWAWIWALNGNLFPLGAETYPLTRGIRVEQAATILIFLCGILSQMKIWKVVKERRARRGEERRKDEAALQQEDENAGKQIEGQNARERRDWDAVFGNPKSPTSVHTAYDSGVGDMDSEKKQHRSSGTATTGTRRSVIIDGDHIEMAQMSPKQPKTAAELVMGKSEADGMVTVHVAVDEVDTAVTAVAVAEHEIMPKNVVHADSARLGAKYSSDELRATAGTPVPKVVPLPFKVPTLEDDGKRDDADCSSIAAIPDYNDDLQETRSVGSKRSSFVRRLSAGSADLFKRISQHSISRQLGKAVKEAGESMEELASPVRADRDSVAATFDDASIMGDEDRGMPSERTRSSEVKTELANRLSGVTNGEKRSVTEAAENEASGERPTSYASTGILDPAAIGTGLEAAAADEKESKPVKSIISEVESGPVSLTKDRLPGRLSKIALSYRTNEWAKHLSYADVPETEELNVPEPIVPMATPIEEQAAPVDVRELQKTAVNATPPPAMPRFASAMSTARRGVPGGQSLHPNSRRTSARMVGAVVEGDERDDSINSKARQAAVRAAAAALVGDSAPAPAPRALPWRPPVPGVVSYDSPQTLIGKRDMIMRVKNHALRPDADAANDETAYGVVSALGPPNLAGGHPDSLSSSRRSSGVYGGPPLSHQNNSGGPPLSHQNNNKHQHFNTSTPPSAAAQLHDDIPLSQRRTLIRERRSSLASMNSNSAGNNSSSRRSSFGYASPSSLVRAETGNSASPSSSPLSLGGTLSSPAPVSRRADLPSQGGMRDSQLRQSVQGGLPSYPYSQVMPMASSGPLIDAVYGIPGTSSSHSLPAHLQAQAMDAEARRDMEAQRRVLLGRREAEARRRESRRAEQARGDRRFEARMRTDSQLMEAHREAMRRMQRKAT